MVKSCNSGFFCNCQSTVQEQVLVLVTITKKLKKKFISKICYLLIFTLLNSSEDEKYLTNKCFVLVLSTSKQWNF